MRTERQGDEQGEDGTFLTAPTKAADAVEAATTKEGGDERHVEEDLKKHEEDRDRMRRELEGYVGELRSREFVSFPAAQTFSTLMEVVEGEPAAEGAPSDSFWGKCLLDEKFAMTVTKDEKVARGLVEVRNLDIVLAKKTKEFREKRRQAAAQQEMASQADKAQPVEVRPDEDSMSLEKAPAQSPFSFNPEERSRMDDINRRLKAICSSGGSLLPLVPVSARADPMASAEAIDSRLAELKSADTRVEPKVPDDQLSQMRDICRITAEARWAADHAKEKDAAEKAAADVDSRAEAIVEEITKRIRQATEVAAQQKPRPARVDPDEEELDREISKAIQRAQQAAAASSAPAPAPSTMPSLPSIGGKETKKARASSSSSSPPAQAPDQGRAFSAPSEDQVVSLPPLPPQPERQSTAPGGSRLRSQGGGHVASSAPCTSRMISTAQGGSSILSSR